MTARTRRHPRFVVEVPGVPPYRGPYMEAVKVYRREVAKDSRVRFYPEKESH